MEFIQSVGMRVDTVPVKQILSITELILYTIYTLEEDVPDDSLETRDQQQHSKLDQVAKVDPIHPVIKQLVSRIFQFDSPALCSQINSPLGDCDPCIDTKRTPKDENHGRPSCQRQAPCHSH